MGADTGPDTGPGTLYVQGGWAGLVFTCTHARVHDARAEHSMATALVVNAVFSGVAFLTADRLLGSQAMRDRFIRAGLFGKDLNKTSEEKVLVVALINAHLISGIKGEGDACTCLGGGDITVDLAAIMELCVCVCVCVLERERE